MALNFFVSRKIKIIADGNAQKNIQSFLFGINDCSRYCLINNMSISEKKNFSHKG